MLLPLRPDQEAHLLKLCEEMGRTPEDFIREAVLTFMEDYEDGRDAQAVLQRIRNGEEGTTSLQELMKKYGVDAGVIEDGGKTDGQTGSASQSSASTLPRTNAHAA